MGAACFLLGAFSSAWANLTWVNAMRRESGEIHQDPALLFEGPFRWMRYPTLFALLLYSFGFALTFRSWTSLVVIVPLTYIMIRRAKLWDEKYLSHYQNLWIARCEKSKRFILFLY